MDKFIIKILNELFCGDYSGALSGIIAGNVQDLGNRRMLWSYYVKSFRLNI